MSAQRRGIAGVTKLRRTLRRIEPEATKGIVKAIDRTANNIMYTMIANAPRRTGDLADSISMKRGRDGMTAVIGPAARYLQLSKSPFDRSVKMSKPGKRALMGFFKAYFYEYGTKGDPENNIPAQPARPFLTPAFDTHKDAGLRDVRRAISDAIRIASEGGDT